MERTEAKVGMQVYFGRGNGEKTLAEVIRVNKKNLKVKTLEGRGTQRDYRVGSIWNVHPALCTPVQEGRPSRVTRSTPAIPVKTGRTEEQIMQEISSIYGGLSPENLHCDGEISRSAAMRKYRAYQRQLKACFKELGREVGEYESYQYFKNKRGY